MPRYVNRIPLSNIDVNFTANEISKYMIGEGFTLENYKGQQVWRKGLGFFTAPQYLTIMFYPDCVVVEGFIKYSLFPGVFVGEFGVDGIFMAFPKGLLRTRINQVEGYLYSILQNQGLAIQQQMQQQG